MRSAVLVQKEKYTCPLCGIDYDIKRNAEDCLEKHNNACRISLPNYRIGMKVLTHHFANVDYGKEHTAIIRIDGELFGMRLLVENNSGERYWVNAIRYHIGGAFVNFEFNVNVPIV